jgi:RNA polymerase primary sigma factor
MLQVTSLRGGRCIRILRWLDSPGARSQLAPGATSRQAQGIGRRRPRMMDIERLEITDRVEALLEEAERQGYLTMDRIAEVFPRAEENLGELDALFDQLRGNGIKVYEDEEGAAADGEGGNGQEGHLQGVPADDTLGLYFTEVGEVPLLTPEEEVMLAKLYERGQKAQQQLNSNGHGARKRESLERLARQGREARARLIEANTRLVISVAKRYRGLGLPFPDLIQAGNVGLIKAVERFDYKRGFKFGTYATWWIRQAVVRSVSQQGRTIRIPVHMGDRIRRVIKTCARMEQETGQRPTPEEMAEEMDGITAEQARQLLQYSRLPISMEKPVAEEDEASEFGDFIEDERMPAPPDQVEVSLLRDSVREKLLSLDPREARVLTLRYGLNGAPPQTLKEVGAALGVTRERARQIERKALRKLRHPRHGRMLREYLR